MNGREMVRWGVDWIHLAVNRIPDWAVVHVVMNVQTLLDNVLQRQ
jgi:hypothetical protein